jgi:hypothetical protein
MSQTRLVKDEADFSHNYDNNRPEVLVADFGMADQILHLRGTRYDRPCRYYSYLVSYQSCF